MGLMGLKETQNQASRNFGPKFLKYPGFLQWRELPGRGPAQL
jgi:hypothetical protein